VAEFAKFFGLALSAFLPLVNPLGSALLFLSIVGTAPPPVYRLLARKVAISAALFLIIVEVTGTAILGFFGISLPVVQVAGGLALAAMGWKLLNGEQAPEREDVSKVNVNPLARLEQKVFYPLTFPITTGPGCMVVMITLSAQASVHGIKQDITAHAGIVVAVLLLSLSVYFCYGYAPAITARISRQTAHGIARVIAFVLLCIGVQIVWNGMRVLLKSVLHS